MKFVDEKGGFEITKKILVLVVLVGLAGMVEAASLYVPGDYLTIQEAVNAANDGDTICCG